jgi:hypothetical protein
VDKWVLDCCNLELKESLADADVVIGFVVGSGIVDAGSITGVDIELAS